MEGRIKKIISNRGFGFIEVEDEEKNVFLHHSNVLNGQFDELKEGDQVTFEVEESAKGPRAVNVERAGKEKDDAEE